ncbi:hypothetical protein ACFSHR_25330 [Azotobacter chroococcum]
MQSPPAERSALDAAYARAMREVVREYPEDQEAATLFAESLMDLSPWQYWSQDGQPRPDTPEMLAQLERVIAANPNHPGACHFFIHAVEATRPERAVPCAERLAGLMPGAGHLVHMPGHIYVRVGRYEDAIKANEHAVHADETFIRDQNPAFGVYLAGYYPHNYDFLAFAASMIGRSGQALAATRKMAELVPQPMLREPGMTFLQQHQTRQLQMLVRFGRWDEILKAPAPSQDLPHARALWHYAHGRALAARGDLPGAEADLAPLRATTQDPQMDALRLEFNTSGAILKIAAEVLAGQIAARKADFPRAIGHLREAAHLEDRLVYGEPRNGRCRYVRNSVWCCWRRNAARKPSRPFARTSSASRRTVGRCTGWPWPCRPRTAQRRPTPCWSASARSGQAPTCSWQKPRAEPPATRTERADNPPSGWAHHRLREPRGPLRRPPRDWTRRAR